MTMDLISTFISKAIDFTVSAFALVLFILALITVWKWLIGICIKFLHMLCPRKDQPKQNDSSNKRVK